MNHRKYSFLSRLNDAKLALKGRDYNQVIETKNTRVFQIVTMCDNWELVCEDIPNVAMGKIYSHHLLGGFK